jgi:tetratricopeptide (TPR) repeat protein
LKLHYEWDWPGCEAAFLRALALDPDHVNAHHRYSHYLAAMSRMPESLSESLLCLSLDPLDPTICHHLGWHYRMARQYDEAIVQHQRVLEMNPERELTHIFLGQAYAQNGMHKQAIDEFKIAFQLGRGAARDLAWLAHAHAIAGERDSATEELDRMLEDAETTYVSPYSIGLVYLALGDLDSAFDWFDKALVQRDPNIVYAATDPDFEHVYTNPRFQSLLQRMRLYPDQPGC